jgi:hypothetical protein
MRTDEWTSLEEMRLLNDAGSVEELHRRLVLFPPAHRNPSDASEPEWLFRRYHDTEGCGAATTALLLVTDGRWRNATGRIMEAIAASGCIGHDDLDLLAQSFLAAGRHLYWQAPEGWFDHQVVIVLEDPTASGPDSCVAESPALDDGPTMIPREVRPPLRRWAAARLVVRDPATWGPVLARTGELDARGAAAVMRGLLDAIDSLPEPARALVRRRAAAWPQRDVRAAAEAGDLPAGRPARGPRRSSITTAGATAAPDPCPGGPQQQERLF